MSDPADATPPTPSRASAAVPGPVRTRALDGLAAALDGVVTPAGYVRQGKALLWVRVGLLARTYVEVQKSRRGQACYVNVGREARLGATLPTYGNDTFWRLSRVVPPEIAVPRWPRRDAIAYGDLVDDVAFAQTISVLVRDHAVPYLRRCHGLFGFRVKPRTAAMPGRSGPGMPD